MKWALKGGLDLDEIREKDRDSQGTTSRGVWCLEESVYKDNEHKIVNQDVAAFGKALKCSGSVQADAVLLFPTERIQKAGMRTELDRGVDTESSYSISEKCNLGSRKMWGLMS